MYFAYAQASKNTRVEIGVLQRDDGSQALSNKDKAEVLQRYFKTVYRVPVAPLNNSPRKPSTAFTGIVLNEALVLKELASLNQHEAAGRMGFTQQLSNL